MAFFVHALSSGQSGQVLDVQGVNGEAVKNEDTSIQDLIQRILNSPEIINTASCSVFDPMARGPIIKDYDVLYQGNSKIGIKSVRDHGNKVGVNLNLVKDYKYSPFTEEEKEYFKDLKLAMVSIENGTFTMSEPKGFKLTSRTFGKTILDNAEIELTIALCTKKEVPEEIKERLAKYTKGKRFICLVEV